jgi:hypothetical protein
MKKDCLDFYVIGAQKAGTTWLHRRLNEIPSNNLPLQKEMHFFDRSKKKYPQNPSKFNAPLPLTKAIKKGGKSIIGSLVKGKFTAANERYLYYFGKYDLNWYQTYMKLHARKGITGDITPSYARLQEEDIRLMAYANPNAKVFYILRDPIERTWSQWRMYLNNRAIQEEVNNFEAFKKWYENLKPNHYLSHIKNFRVHFPKNFYLLFYDAIEKQPIELLKNIQSKLADSTPLKTSLIKIEKKEQQTFSSKIDTRIYQYLFNCLSTELKELHEAIGGYCSHWYYKHLKKTLSETKSPAPLVSVQSLRLVTS